MRFDSYYDPPDYPTVTPIAVHYPRAAKPYKCQECGGEIEKGEKHKYIVELVDDTLYTARWHLRACDYGPDYEGEM